MRNLRKINGGLSRRFGGAVYAALQGGCLALYGRVESREAAAEAEAVEGEVVMP